MLRRFVFPKVSTACLPGALLMGFASVAAIAQVSPRPAPTPAPIPAAYQATTETLPPNFVGHDPDLLFDRLMDLNKRLEKSEFETTDEHARRIGIEVRKPILGNLSAIDTFLLGATRVEAEYDADKRTMQFYAPAYRNDKVSLDRKTATDLSRVNRFAMPLSSRGNNLIIYFDVMNDFTMQKKGYRDGFLAEATLGAEDAKRLKTTVRAVAVVKFEEPYAKLRLSRQMQTRLLDVFFFDPQSGKVLARLSQRTLEETPQVELVKAAANQTVGKKRYLSSESLDPADTSFAEYHERVFTAIEQQWYSLLNQQSKSRASSGKIVVSFRLASDGRVTEVNTELNEVGGIMAPLCNRAILDAAGREGFGAWSSDMRRLVGADHRTIRFSFHYEEE